MGRDRTNTERALQVEGARVNEIGARQDACGLRLGCARDRDWEG